MKINVVKIHKISTFLAASGAGVASILIFLAEFDRQFRWDILPSYIESIGMMLSVLILAIAVPAAITSILLSLYRLAERS